MTSFLSFAWGRASTCSPTSSQESQGLHSDESDAASSPLPPVVAASTSGDTTVYNDGGIHEQPSNTPLDALTTWILTREQPPRTPEGLRPRPTIKTLREELQLPPLAREDASHTPLTWLAKDNARRVLSPPQCFFPPPVRTFAPIEASSSWSVMASPSLSTNSFGDSDYEQRIAASPALVPGKALTAVGALVAQQQQQQRHLNKIDEVDILPRSQNLHQKIPKRDSCKVETDREGDFDDDQHPYYPLDPIESSRTPLRLGLAFVAPTRSPASTNSSLGASPSSLARSYRATKPAKPQDPNMSASSSQQGLMQSALPHRTERYDFAPLVVSGGDHVSGTEVVLAHPSDALSAMSHSIPEHGDESVYSESEGPSKEETAGEGKYLDGMGAALDGALMQRKQQNQYQVKEGLVLDVFQRLRDDLQLVVDIEAMGNAEIQLADWFVPTPVDEEGLLTGFTLRNRQSIFRTLTHILHELNTVPVQEEFFLSPSQVRIYAVSHDEFRRAIFFCRNLVQQAVLASEARSSQNCKRWKFASDLRSALGFIPPESPEGAVRGGDTSVFSLPSDSAETPMTSNVSTTTTITSAIVSPFHGRNSRHFHHKSRLVNGLQIRRTIEIFSTLLQKMSLACRRLSRVGKDFSRATPDSIRAAEEIKRLYLNLISINLDDLKSVVDAFDLVSEQIMPASLSRKVSRDDEEEVIDILIPPQYPQPLHHYQSILPPPLNPSAPWNREECPNQTAPQTILPPMRPGACQFSASGSLNIFSPSSSDMRTWNSLVDDADCEDDEDDDLLNEDLRRQVGSHDYEGEEESREGPFDPLPEDDGNNEGVDMQFTLGFCNLQINTADSNEEKKEGD